MPSRPTSAMFASPGGRARLILSCLGARAVQLPVFTPRGHLEAPRAAIACRHHALLAAIARPTPCRLAAPCIPRLCCRPHALGATSALSALRTQPRARLAPGAPRLRCRPRTARASARRAPLGLAVAARPRPAPAPFAFRASTPSSREVSSAASAPQVRLRHSPARSFAPPARSPPFQTLLGRNEQLDVRLVSSRSLQRCRGGDLRVLRVLPRRHRVVGALCAVACELRHLQPWLLLERSGEHCLRPLSFWFLCRQLGRDELLALRPRHVPEQHGRHALHRLPRRADHSSNGIGGRGSVRANQLATADDERPSVHLALVRAASNSRGHGFPFAFAGTSRSSITSRIAVISIVRIALTSGVHHACFIAGTRWCRFCNAIDGRRGGRGQ